MKWLFCLERVLFGLVLLGSANSYAAPAEDAEAGLDSGYFIFGLGKGANSVDGFERGSTMDIGFGRALKWMDIEIGYRELGPFVLQSTENSFVEVRGFYVLIGRRFFLADEWYLQPHAELYNWKASAVSFGKNFNSDEGRSPKIGLRLLSTGKRFQWGVGFSHVNNISQSNISFLTGEIRVRF